MPHNINENRIAYVGQVPWHGIGKRLEHPMSSQEALRYAKLDYKVELVSLFSKLGGELNNFKAVIREDTRQHLGIVSNRYKVLQNRSAFNFFDDVIGTGQAVYHVAGALGLGERIWILAKLNDNLIIKGAEEVEKYLCLTNSHDGKSSLKMYFTPIRVVCQNTLNISLKDSQDGVCIKHTTNITQRVAQAQSILKLANDTYQKLSEEFNFMASFDMNVENAEKFFRKVLFGHDKIEKLTTNQTHKLNSSLNLFEIGAGNENPQIRHSAWAAYNAVTEYVDHHSTFRNLEKDPTNRLKSIWFGNGANIKIRALSEIKNIVGIK